MRKVLSIVALLVALGTVTGVALQPDDGTAVTRPPRSGLRVDGADHAKPLPRISSVADLLPALSVAVTTLLLAVAGARSLAHRPATEVRDTRSALLALAVARRGPPVAF